MGSQVPDVPVRFAASFGRRLLYDPAYNRVDPVARCAWYEANLIATEFDGRFPMDALILRLENAIQRGPLAGGPFEPEVWIEQLEEAGLIKPEDDTSEWWQIIGWGKYQPDPLEIRTGKPLTPAEKMRNYRARKKDGVTAVTPVTAVTKPLPAVTPRAGASESSSSSKSKKPPRTPAREGRGGGGMKSFKEALKDAGYDPSTTKPATRLDGQDKD